MNHTTFIIYFYIGTISQPKKSLFTNFFKFTFIYIKITRKKSIMKFIFISSFSYCYFKFIIIFWKFIYQS